MDSSNNWKKLRTLTKSVIASPILVIVKLNPIYYLRKLKLLLSAFFHGGQVVLGKNVRLNQPVYFMGLGKLVLEDQVSLGYWLGGVTPAIMLQPRNTNSQILIAKGTTIMNGCQFIACILISIGKNCRIGSNCVIYDTDFHEKAPTERDKASIPKSVRLGDNVWLGSNVIILKGVEIGTDAVVGAGAVVTKSVPSGAIVGGNPAKILGTVYA